MKNTFTPLFRGYSASLNKWLEGFYVVDPKGKHRIYYQPFEGASCNTYHFVIPESVGVWTGLLDKNGNKIFGPIGEKGASVVKVDCSGVGGAFDDGVYKISYLLPDCGFFLEQLDEQNAISFNECYEYEIIGNLFETPELLKP